MKHLALESVIHDIKTIMSQNDAQIKRIGVFGSLAKGKAHEKSDIDIAIEYDPGENFSKYSFDSVVGFCKACEILETEMGLLYGRKIDVIPVEERKGCLLDDIREEVVWI